MVYELALVDTSLLDIPWKWRREEAASSVSRGLSVFGYGRDHALCRIGFTKRAHGCHALPNCLVGFGIRRGKWRRSRGESSVVVHAPQVNRRWAMVINVPSRGEISRPWRGRSRSQINFGRSSDTT